MALLSRTSHSRLTQRSRRRQKRRMTPPLRERAARNIPPARRAMNAGTVQWRERQENGGRALPEATRLSYGIGIVDAVSDDRSVMLDFRTPRDNPNCR